MMKQFWAYSRNEEGDLIANICETDSLVNAVDDVIDRLSASTEIALLEVGYHIVDQKNGGNTVWYAGPIDWVRPKE